MPLSDLDAPPTEASLRELYNYVFTHAWSEQRALDKRLLDMIFNVHAVPTPDTAAKGRRRRVQPERMVTQEAGRIVELIAALYTPVSSIGVMDIGGEGLASSARRDRVEIALQETMDQLNPAIDSPRKRDIWNLVSLGRIARLGPMQGDVYWWDMPKKTEVETEREYRVRYNKWHTKAPIPLVWLDLPPESTFPASWGRMKDEVISTKQMNWYDLMDIFSPKELAEILPDKDKPQDYKKQVTLGMYSNRRYLTYVVFQDAARYQAMGLSMGSKHFDKIIRTVPHNLGQSVIRILPGPTTGRREDGRYWLSALAYVWPLIKDCDRLLSIAATGAKMDALPIFKFHKAQDIDSEGAQGEDELFLDGDILELNVEVDGRGREDIEALHQPQYGEKTLNLLQFQLNRIERISGAAEVLEGALGPSGMPAWSRRAAIDVASARLQGTTDGVVAADLDAAELILRATAEFGEKIVLFNNDKGKIILDPEEVKELAPILKSEFALLLPQSRIVNWQLMMEMITQVNANNVPLSIGWIMENVGNIPQPEKQWEGSIQWAAMTDPRIRQLLVTNKIKELEADIAEEEGMALEDFMSIPPEDLPPGVQQLLANRLAGAQGQNGATPPQGGLLQGASQAGAGFGQAPGGPQPPR